MRNRQGTRWIAAGLTASVLVSQGGCAEVFAETPAETPKEAENYNMLFITVDQEHYFADYPEESHYQARQLLEELGTTFEKHYACSNMSTSSRSVMFTGLHIPGTGMLDNTDLAWQNAMDDSLTTVGDMMRQAGYYTALKGKWHLGDASILTETESQLTSLEDYGYSDWGGTDYIGSVREGNETDPVIVSETLQWLQETGQPLNEEGTPFFLNVNLVNPHDIMNYDTTGFESAFMKLAGKPDDALYEKTYADEIPASWNFDFTAEDVPDALRLYQSHWGMYAGVIRDADTWKDYQDYYYNCIQDSDNNLMEILSYLQESGLMDNTIIVFTADHGEMHGSHGLKGKGGFLYENNIHVPLIIVHPDYEGGRRISAVTSHVDLAPTFVDMTALSPDEKQAVIGNLPGKSLVPLLDGSGESVREGSLFCFEMLSMTALQFGRDEEGNVTYSFDTEARGMVRGLITERYKFARYFSALDFNTPETMEDLLAHNDLQLFDLENDPEELVNLAADPETDAELIMSLNAQLNQLIEEEIGTDDGMQVKMTLQALLARMQGG